MFYPSALHLLLACTIISTCLALECYVCDNQEDNKGKCVKSIKTCEQGEDVCLTEIRWGSIPYFNQGAQKQYFISKRCSTKSLCERYRESNMHLCTHIWYEDWKCSECCKGDRCNYFVISGSDAHSISGLVGVVSTIALILYR
ncbi:UPAR/Ly6 domain-containing protein cold [Atheta coriaria]|uniref:UPAR/Ly6 domain-containing protein cold n=1 Tax=Dalotia coriaria TaxID=877792 RepID=UPI0031F41498